MCCDPSIVFLYFLFLGLVMRSPWPQGPPFTALLVTLSLGVRSATCTCLSRPFGPSTKAILLVDYNLVVPLPVLSYSRALQLVGGSENNAVKYICREGLKLIHIYIYIHILVWAGAKKLVAHPCTEPQRAVPNHVEPGVGSSEEAR